MTINDPQIFMNILYDKLHGSLHGNYMFKDKGYE